MCPFPFFLGAPACPPPPPLPPARQRVIIVLVATTPGDVGYDPLHQLMIRFSFDPLQL